MYKEGSSAFASWTLLKNDTDMWCFSKHCQLCILATEPFLAMQRHQKEIDKKPYDSMWSIGRFHSWVKAVLLPSNYLLFRLQAQKEPRHRFHKQTSRMQLLSAPCWGQLPLARQRWSKPCSTVQGTQSSSGLDTEGGRRVRVNTRCLVATCATSGIKIPRFHYLDTVLLIEVKESAANASKK